MQNNGVVFNDRNQAGFFLFNELRNGPVPAAEVKAAIIEGSSSIKGGFCGTVVQYHFRLVNNGEPRLAKKMIRGRVHYMTTTAGKSYAKKKFGVMSDKQLAAQKKSKPAKATGKATPKKRAGKATAKKTRKTTTKK